MKLLTLLFTTLLMAAAGYGQTKMIINKNDGTADSLSLSEIKNITFKTYPATPGSIYSEDFTSKPNYTLYETPMSGDTYTWDSTSGVYKIHLTETVESHYKYALSPIFTRVNDTDFTVQIDVKPISVSFGMGMQVHFFDADSGISSTSIFDIVQTGSDDPRFRFYDASQTNYPSSATTMGTWYTVLITYHNLTKTADLKVVTTATSATFFQQSGVPFTVKSFNRIGIGSSTAVGDGTTAEMWYDNISVRYGQ